MISVYLLLDYEFRYNTVLGRTEYRGKSDAHFLKVGRYEINTLRRELDNDVGIVTSSDNLYSIIESSFSPRVNPIQEYFKVYPWWILIIALVITVAIAIVVIMVVIVMVIMNTITIVIFLPFH